MLTITQSQQAELNNLNVSLKACELGRVMCQGSRNKWLLSKPESLYQSKFKAWYDYARTLGIVSKRESNGSFYSYDYKVI